MRAATILSALSLAILQLASSPLFAAEAVPDDAIATIDKLAAEGIEHHRVASIAVGVVKDGQVVLTRAYGFADLENEVPATTDTVYRIASVTKQFTAMAIMLLVEDGKLSLDDELTKFLPDYPTGDRKITIRQLLNHTSGIKDYTRGRDFFKLHRHDFTHAEMLALFQNEPFDFEPGAKHGYSNSGYYLLGMIIEKLSGQTYEEVLTARIFKPLGMNATRYGHPQPLIKHRAKGSNYFFGQLTNGEAISMDPPFAGGGLVSNVLDLAKWVQALEEGGLVSSASYEEMYRPAKLTNGATRPYGFGWRLGELAGHRMILHGGGIQGFSSMIARYPDDHLAIIVLCNTEGRTAHALADRIAEIMLGVEAKRPTRKPVDDKPVVDEPIDAALIEHFVGKYQLGPVEEIELISTDGQLFAAIKGRPRDRLKYQGERKFIHANDDQIRISFGPKDGKAKVLKIEGDGFDMEGRRVE